MASKGLVSLHVCVSKPCSENLVTLGLYNQLRGSPSC